MAFRYNDKRPFYVADTNISKYVDDTTISENVWKHETSKIESSVDELKKERQLLTNFSSTKLNLKNCVLPCILHPLSLMVKKDVVSSAKLLGVNISKDLEWNIPISEIVKEVSRLYFLRAKILGGNGTSTRVSILAD